MNESNAQPPPHSECLIEGADLHKKYRNRREIIHVLRGIHLDVFKGEILGIVGASGVGKSTLLHIIGGLDRPDAGKVVFQGKNIYTQGNSYLDRFRNNHVGFVFQFFNLLSDFTALENAMFPLLIKDGDRAAAEQKAMKLLGEVGLADRLNHKPGELSGGESQRVALARALINRPDLVLADEPTGNLDARTGDSLMELIRRLNREFDQTFVIVTHSHRIAAQLDRVMELSEGRLRSVDKNVII